MPERKSTWQLQEAKNKLSEVIRRAREEGPQTITVRGEPAVLITTCETKDNRPESHAEFFRRIAQPLRNSEHERDADFERSHHERPRPDIDLG